MTKKPPCGAGPSQDQEHFIHHIQDCVFKIIFFMPYRDKMLDQKAGKLLAPPSLDNPLFCFKCQNFQCRNSTKQHVWPTSTTHQVHLSQFGMMALANSDYSTLLFLNYYNAS